MGTVVVGWRRAPVKRRGVGDWVFRVIDTMNEREPATDVNLFLFAERACGRFFFVTVVYLSLLISLIRHNFRLLPPLHRRSAEKGAGAALARAMVPRSPPALQNVRSEFVIHVEIESDDNGIWSLFNENGMNERKKGPSWPTTTSMLIPFFRMSAFRLSAFNNTVHPPAKSPPPPLHAASVLAQAQTSAPPPAATAPRRPYRSAAGACVHERCVRFRDT